MNRDFRYIRDKYTEQGAREIFERVCEQLLILMHPNENVKLIKANPGDDGIDVAIGNIGVTPITVCQCKFFLDKIGTSQQSQIKKSLKRALNSKNYTLKNWWLFIPKDSLDLEEAKWWDDLKSKSKVSLDIFTGSRFIALAKKHKIYEQIFEIEDSLMIKEILEILKAKQQKKKLTNRECDINLFYKHLICFDRPAFWDSCLTEIRLSEFYQAIEDITLALTTGKLFSRKQIKLKSFSPVTNYKTIEFIELFTLILGKLSELKRLLILLQESAKKVDISYDSHPMFVMLIPRLNEITDLQLIREFLLNADNIDKKRNEIISLLKIYTDMPRLIELSSTKIIKDHPKLVFVVRDNLKRIANELYK